MKVKKEKTAKPPNSSREIGGEKARFGDHLVAVRKEMHLTQQAFSEMTGIPLSTLKNYEGSHSAPGAEALAQLMHANINVHYLLSGEGPKTLHLLNLRHASNAAARFALKRSSIPEGEIADLVKAALELKLDEDGLEREYGARYPISRSALIDTARLSLAIATVEAGLARTGGTPDSAGRAELIATVYEMLEEPADRNRERILRLLKLAS